MLDLEAELKSLKLFGMASSYAEVASQGGASLQSSEWLLRQMLQAEIEDQHIRSIRYQLQSARFPVHRSLAGFDFAQAKVDRTWWNNWRVAPLSMPRITWYWWAALVPAKPIWPPLLASKPLPTTASGFDFIPPSIWSRNWNGRKPPATKASWLIA